MVQLVRASLAVGPGAVKVHGYCCIIHVAGGVGRVISLVLVPLGVPVVARGVLLEVLTRSVVELAILEELVGRLASSSGQRFEDLFCFGYVDRRVSVQAVGRVGDGVGGFKDAVEDSAGETHQELLDAFVVVLVEVCIFDQLFEIYDVLVDVWPVHLQVSQFGAGFLRLSSIQVLGTELGDKLVIGVLVVWLSA